MLKREARNSLALLPLEIGDVPYGLRMALEQEGVPTLNHERGRARGRYVLFDSRRAAVRPAPGQTAIDIRSAWHNDRVGDPWDALTDWSIARRAWKAGDLEVRERVARHDKRVVRERVLERVRQLVEAKGGVWLRIGAFPAPYRTALNLRIDYDEYVAADFARMLSVVETCPDATSHYVSGAAYEGEAGALARLRGLHVGGHGFYHHTYRTRAENRVNLLRGMEALERAGIRPVGFVAPHGRFHPQLGEALDDAGVTHSSEFAWAFDELPMWTPFSRALQIPIHPVCFGSFLEARENAAAPVMVDRACAYFTEVMRAKFDACEPMFLYGHPSGRLGRYPAIARRILEAATWPGVWKVTLAEFESWWRWRRRFTFRLVEDGSGYRVEIPQDGARYQVTFEMCSNNGVAVVPVDAASSRIHIGELQYERRGEPGTESTLVETRIRGRERLREFLDWERATPVHEIRAVSWRHRLKRTLRRIDGYRHRGVSVRESSKEG